MKDRQIHHRLAIPAGSLLVAALGVLAQSASAQPAPDGGGRRPPAPPAGQVAPPTDEPRPGDAPTPPPPPRPERDRRGGPERGRDRGADEKPVSVGGALQGFNLSPRGEVEGMLLGAEGGRTVQVNFPPPIGATITQSLKAGDSISAMAVPRMSMPDHPVYDLVSLKAGDKEIKVPRPEDAKDGKVEGTVKRLNYARDGRVNGAVLEGGEFVHVGPEAAEQIKLAVGQKVTVEGMQTTSLSGGTVVDAATVNGVAARPEPREGPMARRGGPRPGGPADREGPRERGPRPGPEGGPDGAPKPPPAPPQQ